MIPPPLREHLVRKLTQKLVESPTFNSLVHNTHGTISAFLEGIEEGRRQKEGVQVKQAENDATQRSQQQQQQQTNQHNQSSQDQASSSSYQSYSPSHEFEKPRSTPFPDPRTPPPPPPKEESTVKSDGARSSSGSSSASKNEATTPGMSSLEAFLQRTRASIEEAERRAEAQRKNKS